MPASLFMDEERSTHKNTDLRKEENTYLDTKKKKR
jgi:hypothetical protein